MRGGAASPRPGAASTVQAMTFVESRTGVVRTHRGEGGGAEAPWAANPQGASGVDFGVLPDLPRTSATRSGPCPVQMTRLGAPAFALTMKPGGTRT